MTLGSTEPLFLLIDKPAGITSHDVVDRVRKITGERTVGHAGTLDPFATGLLIVGVGRAATKQLGNIVKTEKEYIGTAVLGATSNTQDGTGVLTTTPSPQFPSKEKIIETINSFIGKQKQTPPMFSAKKVKGRKLYELARKGEEVKREPVDITIYECDLISYEQPRLTFRVRCSSGTYIRTLAHDIGTKLGTGAYLESLRRTKIGEYSVENAQKLPEFLT